MNDLVSSNDFLRVVAIGGGDRLDAALEVPAEAATVLELLFAVVLDVFNLDHRWSPFPDLSVTLPGAPGSLHPIIVRIAQ